MVTHSNEEVEEQLAALFHLLCHRCAALERVAAADDESEVVSSQLRIVLGSVSIRPTSRGQQRGHGDILLQALLAEGETFKVIKAIELCSTAGSG